MRKPSLHSRMMKSRKEICQQKVMEYRKKVQKSSKYSLKKVHELKEVVKLPDI